MELKGAAASRIRIFASSVVLLALWKTVSLIVARDIILPAPEAAFLYLSGLLDEAATWAAIGATLRRVALSFLLNIAAATATGVAAGFSVRFSDAVAPLIAIMKAVPTMGVILLSLIWFNSETAVVFVCTLIVFPLIYGAIVTGIRHLDRQLLEMHRVFHIPAWKTLMKFVLPSLRPYLLSGVMSGLGLSMKVVIAAEVLSQPKVGIGTMFQVERSQLNTVGVFAWSIMVILLTAGMDAVFHGLKKRYGYKV
ncbi:MAG: ABC transporter permease subunit [Spirochaetaceae bacterium]|nr:ABC transporter permease subunit [Spirochaetaceae bacterium]